MNAFRSSDSVAETGGVEEVDAGCDSMLDVVVGSNWSGSGVSRSSRMTDVCVSGERRSSWLSGAEVMELLIGIVLVPLSCTMYTNPREA